MELPPLGMASFLQLREEWWLGGAWGREKRQQEQRGRLEWLAEEEGFERGEERPGGWGEAKEAGAGSSEMRALESDR